MYLVVVMVFPFMVCVGMSNVGEISSICIARGNPYLDKTLGYCLADLKLSIRDRLKTRMKYRKTAHSVLPIP